MSYVVVFFVFSELTRDVSVRFDDIVGIVHHLCLDFLPIISSGFIIIFFLHLVSNAF